jgi:hypothetical protein
MVVLSINDMSKDIPNQSNFIAIGAWNPAIIQPHWLRKFFSDKIPETCQIEITSVGVASAIRMSYPKVTIDPNNGRLVFIPKDLSDDTLKYICDLSMGIHGKLEHTPIIAAGSNFVYRLETGEYFSIDEVEKESEILDLYKDLKEQGQLVEKSIRHSFSGNDYTINITYDYSGNDRFLRINFDYRGADPMKRAAEKLIENFKYSLILNKQLIRKQ